MDAARYAAAASYTLSVRAFWMDVLRTICLIFSFIGGLGGEMIRGSAVVTMRRCQTHINPHLAAC